MSTRTKQELSGISLLGNQGTKYPSDYAPEILETFINKHQDHDYFVKFNCPEFTSLCPMTGQPDFASIYIQTGKDMITLMTCHKENGIIKRYLVFCESAE